MFLLLEEDGAEELVNLAHVHHIVYCESTDTLYITGTEKSYRIPEGKALFEEILEYLRKHSAVIQTSAVSAS